METHLLWEVNFRPPSYLSLHLCFLLSLSIFLFFSSFAYCCGFVFILIYVSNYWIVFVSTTILTNIWEI
jgi:hypothetical protein